ncbi:MFS transporter [Actinosynnema pretiosum subsp. pretiosum]|uniref:Multidrug efflux pump Tap n=1 Tax=Actinosynnema pretiosum subsp. pretiosum TaxID=103721 RepID=A0AA45R552_9PSEU|nr:MFS transporter [Actinosynnema mirum]AXX30247.1 major facilitator superfamily MFS_1 [Actinosynnema pretiosum subsp. pretiosum]QUF05596.1 MFS transporter [Actinosynnema pretiosum subsp. pretiosum]
MRRDVVVYLGSYGLGLLGNTIGGVVLPLLVLARTGDVLAAGLLATTSAAASAVVGVLAGVLVDRFNRRTVSVVANMLSALSVAALPVVDALWGLDLGWFLVLGVLGALVDAPGMTAHEVLLPNLVRDQPKTALDRLVATREALAGVLVLAGPGIGGLLVWLLGASSALLWITAGTSALAALLTLALDRRAGEVTPSEGSLLRRAGADLVVSWRFMARSRVLLGSTAVSAVFVAVLTALQTTVMPAYFTREELPGLTGLTLSALAAGGIVGSVVYAAAAGRVRRRVWFVVGMVGTALGIGLIGAMISPWAVLGGAALLGAANGPIGAVLGVLAIEVTPDELRGRVIGAQNSLLLAAPALTTAPIAAVAAGAGLEVAGALVAGVLVVTALVALGLPVFRTLDDPVHAGGDGDAGDGGAEVAGSGSGGEPRGAVGGGSAVGAGASAGGGTGVDTAGGAGSTTSA